VYVAEAHARDEWPVGQRISAIEQPTTLEQRVAAARSFVEMHGVRMDVLVDTMSNEFLHTWGSWPFRFYGLEAGCVALKAQPGQDSPSCYNLQDLEDWLASL